MPSVIGITVLLRATNGYDTHKGDLRYLISLDSGNLKTRFLVKNLFRKLYIKIQRLTLRIFHLK